MDTIETMHRYENNEKLKQESCAIAKMTAQCADCALCMGALKIIGNP